MFVLHVSEVGPSSCDLRKQTLIMKIKKYAKQARSVIIRNFLKKASDDRKVIIITVILFILS